MAKQINFGGALIKQFGAYIRTDLTGLVDINGVASGVIGIIGLAEKGPVNRAVTINGYTQLVETFGDGPLVRHGLAAYVGGAQQLVAIRTGDPSAASLTAIDAVPGADPTKNYTWESTEMGSLGNNIYVEVASQESSGDENYVIRIKYIDSRGNDIRETFVVPHFIPDKTGMYWSANDGDYYVLRNRESGVIREIPSTWGFGNIDEEAFFSKVEDLKSTDEDLLGPFPADAGENPYPLALIAGVVNNGGLGQAPSGLVRLTGSDPSIEELLAPGYGYVPAESDELLTHQFVQMSGGNNGDDGTNFYGIVDDITGQVNYNSTFDTGSGETIMGAWDTSLGIMEDEDVNFVQPAYLFNYKRNTDDDTDSNTFEWTTRYNFFKSLIPKFLAHITTMSSIKNRKFRTMVAGIPFYRIGSTENNTAQDFLDAVEDVSGLINDDRVQLWTGGFRSRAFSSRVENYGGEMLASFAVGAHASREVSVSLTFAQLSGIFTDGLEFAFNQAQKDELYTRSQAFVLKRRNSVGAVEFVVAHNYTSFTGASSRGLQLFITRRIVDYMNTFVYKNLEENFIGRKARGAETASAISDFVSALLNRLIREDVLVAFANVRAWADDNDKTIYYVEYDFQPVTEINFIPVTNKLLYKLA